MRSYCTQRHIAYTRLLSKFQYKYITCTQSGRSVMGSFPPLQPSLQIMSNFKFWRAQPSLAGRAVNYIPRSETLTCAHLDIRIRISMRSRLASFPGRFELGEGKNVSPLSLKTASRLDRDMRTCKSWNETVVTRPIPVFAYRIWYRELEWDPTCTRSSNKGPL